MLFTSVTATGTRGIDMVFPDDEARLTVAQQGADHTPARNASDTISLPCAPLSRRCSRWPRSSRSPTAPATMPPGVATRCCAPRRRDRGRGRDPLVDARGRAPARPAHLGHRPLQLPLRLLHAQGRLRARLPVPAARRPADVRGDHAARARVRGARRREDPPHRRRAAAAPERRAPGRDARRHRRARPHADDQRRAARAQGKRAARRRPAARDGEPRLARRRASSAR